MTNNAIVDVPVIGQKVVQGEQLVPQMQSLLESIELALNSGKVNEYTSATVPDATKSEGSLIVITDSGSGYALALSDGATWNLIEAGGVGTGDLLSTNNLSDVTNAATALANLGPTATAAEINLLDLSGLTTGWGLLADSASTASWQALPSGGGATAIDDLTDVDTTTDVPVIGDTLVFDGTNWVTNLTQLIREVDDVAGTTIYIGEAQAGTTTATAAWRVKRIVFTGDDSETLFADGDVLFNNTWTGRAGFSYS